MISRAPLPEGWHFVPLGPDHAYRVARGQDGEVDAYVIWHRIATGEWCGGYCFVRPARGETRAIWRVVSQEPLTLTPSAWCKNCGDDGMCHGFVTGGVWVPAGAIPGWVAELSSDVPSAPVVGSGSG